MGLLDKLWDDTVAGPRPETWLGQMRQRSSFSLRPNSGKETAARGGNAIGESDDTAAAALLPMITMSIMIKRPTGCPSPANATPPLSPAEPSTPVTPFTRKGQTEWNRFRRKSSSDAYERGSCVGSSKNPTSPFEM